MVVLKCLGAWFGMMIIAIINGGFRDFVYKPHVGELPAHQISTVILIMLFGVYFLLLNAVWPIKSAAQAWKIGCIWFLMTEAFEFGAGRLVAGHSWGELFHAYNVCAGQVWIFIPLWVFIGPYLVFCLDQTKKAGNCGAGNSH